MVRLKHRYLLVQVDRDKAVERDNVLYDVRPLETTEFGIMKVLRELILQMHGDYGRALVTHGIKIKYMNEATRIVVIRTRHGEPYKIVASTLPFLTKLAKQNVVCRTLYTGATIRHTNIFLEKYQKRIVKQITDAKNTANGRIKYSSVSDDDLKKVAKIKKQEKM